MASYKPGVAIAIFALKIMCVSEQSMQIANRAYLSIHSIKPDKIEDFSNIAVIVKFINTGQTPAYNIRNIGSVTAADLITDKNRGGYQVYQTAIKLGAFLRPLGNTIYWLPPLNTSKQTLQDLADITQDAIIKTLN